MVWAPCGRWQRRLDFNTVPVLMLVKSEKALRLWNSKLHPSTPKSKQPERQAAGGVLHAGRRNFAAWKAAASIKHAGAWVWHIYNHWNWIIERSSRTWIKKPAEQAGSVPAFAFARFRALRHARSSAVRPFDGDVRMYVCVHLCTCTASLSVSVCLLRLNNICRKRLKLTAFNMHNCITYTHTRDWGLRIALAATKSASHLSSAATLKQKGLPRTLSAV